MSRYPLHTPRMRLAIKIGAPVVALVAVVLGFAASRPDTHRVERAIAVNAPPDWVFPLVNNFMRWRDWSPWEKPGAPLKRTFGAMAAGRNATYWWQDAEHEAGAEIKGITLPSRVRLELAMHRPHRARYAGEFAFEARGGTTQVTWFLEREARFRDKLVRLYGEPDADLARDMEAGLARLKAAAEK